jgi:hypothetical protein
MAAFLAKMAQQRNNRNSGGTNARVHLHHNGRLLSPKFHLRHLRTVWQLYAPKQKVWNADMCIDIVRFPALDFQS